MRKNQRLINFHTSGLTSMPVASDVHYGEIVVRHNEQQPELLIKVSESKFGVIPGSGAVASAISVAVTNVTNYIDGEVNTIESSITELQTAVSAVSTNIGENYVSKTAFEEAQGKLFTSATTVASDDATAKANKAKEDAISAAAASATTLLGLVDGVDDRVNTVSGDLNTFKTTVASTYATQESVTSAIATAKSEAIDAAATDATTKANNAKSDAIAAAAASADTLNKSIETVDGKVDTLSGNVESLKTDLTDTINKKVATAYRYQKTVTNYADLPTSEMSKDTIGFVYNVENANDNYPAGTNYAWNGTEWDALGGSVDLSPYALKTEVSASAETLNNRVDTVSTSLETFKTTVANTYATKEELKSTSGSIITAYTNAIAAAKESIKQTTDTISSNLRNLSASTVNIETTANSAIQNASIVDGDTCKVSVKKEGTELQFDFKNLVIDCGDF